MDNDEQAASEFWGWQPNLQFVKQPCLRSRLRFLHFKLSVFSICLALLAVVGDPCTTKFAAGQIIAGDRADELRDEIERSLRDTLMLTEQSVFIPTPREVLRPLLRADRAIKEKDITRAVSLLGEVLSDSTTEDFLVPVTDSVDGVSTSLRLRAQGILGLLPQKDRQLYRVRYGVQAKKMLDKAIQEDDFDGVSQVMQRFFFTDAGFDAAMLLGHYHLDEGRPVAAANCFARVTGSAEGRGIHDPEASVLLATCWMLGDSPDRATKALKELKKTSKRNSIEFMEKPIRLFDQSESPLEWLQNLIGDSPLRDIEMVNQWLMLGGNPQRNARSGTGFPLITPRWSTLTLNDPDMEKSIIKKQNDLIYLKSAPIPSVQPLAVGDTIVMRSFDQMMGVDHKSGKRMWVFPPADFTATFDSTDDKDKPKSLPGISLTERMWLDSIYGQASSDGQRIFVVPKPGFSRQAATRSRGLLRRTYNELKAVDIERQGALVWEVGGDTGLDEPKLAKSLFLGPPLPLGGELFAVCRNESEVLLVVLDARTGKLKWSRRLGTTETSIDLGSDRRRRLAGATPSFADGIVVCSTGTGALVGVDLSTRSLLWGYQYASPGKKEVQPISPSMVSNSDPLTGLWRDSAITIASGKVLFTPIDSQDLICVDLQNGYPAFEPSTGAIAKAPRGDALFVACVENGLVILQGETNVRAISLATGNPVWKLELKENGKPSGRGYANRGSYFFPTTSEHVVQVDMKTGELLKAVRTDGVLGNLVCHRGDVLSHGVDRLSCYSQDEPNRELIELAEKTGEFTHQQLAIKSQLQLQDGDLRSAIESIELALAQSKNRSYERLLLELILQMMETDFEFGSELAQKHNQALLETRKLDYLTSKVGGLIRAGKYDDSSKELLALLDPIEDIKILSSQFIEVSTQTHDAKSSNTLEVDSLQQILKTDSNNEKMSIRLDRWIASRIEWIYDQADDQQQTALRKNVNELANRIVEEFSPSVNFDDSESRQLFNSLEVLPRRLIDPQTRLKLLTKFLADGEHFQANALLDSLIGNPESQTEVAAQATALMAQYWLDSGSPARALKMAQRIKSDFPEIMVSGETSGADFSSSITEQIKPDQVDKNVSQPFNLVETTSTTVAQTPNYTPCRIVLRSSDEPEYETYQFRFLQQTGEFYINDADGKQIHRFYARREHNQKSQSYNQFTEGEISIRGDLALVDLAREMFVFDLVKLQMKQPPVLWYKNLPGGEPDNSNNAVSDDWCEIPIKAHPHRYENRLYVSPIRSDVMCYVDSPNLIGLDARSGKKLWQRPLRLQGSILLGDKDHIAAWSGTKREADFYSPTDGRLVATKKLPANAGAVWSPYGTKLLVSNDRVAAEPEKSLPDDTGDSAQDSGKESDRKKRPPARVKTLGLFDLFSGKMLWETEFPISTRHSFSTMACRVGKKRIAVLPPDSDLQFIDVKDGSVAFTTPIKLPRADRQRVEGIGAVEKKGKYLVHLKRGYCPTRTVIKELDVSFLYLNYNELTWLGDLICVDSQTGEDLWKNHVRFDYQQIGQETPYNTPLYFFLRRFNTKASNNSDSRCQVIAINLETGCQVCNTLIQPMSGYQAIYHFANDPDNQQMTLSYDRHQTVFNLRLSDDLPPTPVAHLLRRNAIPKQFLLRENHSLDAELIKAEQKKVLQKAIDAQELLAQKRAEEKRLLETEKASR